MSDITRRDFIKGSAAAVCTAIGIPVLAEAARTRPNLVFVFSDQHSHDMLGCYGNEQILTPSLDRFASEGVRFDHCVSSSPVCTPYRGMLLSGQHPLYNGAFVNDIRMLPSHSNYFADILTRHGYRTGYIGKWHLYGGPRNRPIPPGRYRYGFDGTFLSNNCTLDFCAGHSYYWNDAGEKVTFDEWEPYGQTRQALQFLDGCAPDEPFALFLSWHPPHGHLPNCGEEYTTEPDLMGLYDPARIRLRPNAPDRKGIRESYQGYMAQCTGIDRAFGWITEKLKSRGLDRNTIVVYTSDHGDLLFSHGRPWPKRAPEDWSIRVPLIIRWPGHLKAGRNSDLLVGTLDLMPTVLGLMNLPIPKTCHGRDLSADMLGGCGDSVESVPLFIICRGQGWRGIYTHRYTYSWDEGLDSAVRWNCLYDRKRDPWEKTNLIDSAGYSAVREKLHEEAREWMERFGDRFVPAEAVLRACFGAGWNEPGRPFPGIVPGHPMDLTRSLPGVRTH